MKAIKDLGKKTPQPSLTGPSPSSPVFETVYFHTERTTGQVGISLGQTMWFELSDAYIDVIQLCTARGLGDEIDDFAQVTHVDAPLMHGFSQGCPIHWEHRVIQAVLDLQGMYRLLLLSTNMKERISI